MIIVFCAAFFVAAVICAALRLDGGRLRLRTVLLCAGIGLVGLAALVLPFMIGAFVALLKYAYSSTG